MMDLTRRFLFQWVTALVVVAGSAEAVRAGDWLTSPARYTHSSRSGYRVNQYQPIAPVYHTPNANQIVYRSMRSALQVGNSADYYYFVDQYGDAIRPYGEWRYPYRPFSTPYPNWRPQPFGFGGNGFGDPTPYGGAGGMGDVGGVGGGIGSPYGPSGVINGGGFPPSWTNGDYPDVTRERLPPQPLPRSAPTYNNRIIGNQNTIQNQ